MVLNLANFYLQFALKCHLPRIITDASGQEQRVAGPGVIGLYPEVVPGSTFDYKSCTSSSQLPGYEVFGCLIRRRVERLLTHSKHSHMCGVFNFVDKASGSEFAVTVPRFELKKIDFRLYDENGRLGNSIARTHSM
jgi:uncharacterized protein affecting Mg2+/Co2+ transport